MSEQRRNSNEQNLNRSRRPQSEAGAGDPGARIKRLQRRQGRLRRRALIALLLAAVLLVGVFAGGRAATDSEQRIRIALGQKNYTVEGEEGPVYYKAEYSDPEELREDSAEAGLDIAREGIVLLRNEGNLLPLRKGAAISVFGSAAVKPVLSSTAEVTGVRSLKEELEEAKLRVNDKLWSFTDRGGGNNFSRNVEKSLEEYSEAAVVVIGRSGSGEDFTEPAYGEEEEVTGAKALQLTEEERGLLSYVSEHFENVIVVLNIGGLMDVKWFVDNQKIQSVL